MARFDDARDRVAAHFCGLYEERAREQFGVSEAGDFTDMFSEIIRASFIAGWDARDYMSEPADEGEIIASLSA